MKNTLKRILTSFFMLLVCAGFVAADYFLHLSLIRWLTVALAIGMSVELLSAIFKNSKGKKVKRFSRLTMGLMFTLWSLLFITAAYFMGDRPWVLLLTLLTISSADIGAWFFGKLIGGDKMWPNLSPNKTWSGQIAGFLCGTFASVMYGLLGSDAFFPQLMWIGMSVSLLSQYGDLTASWVKRKMGIKDFSNILPGHGGLMDRFDGWIYVLPIIWLMTLV